MNLFQLPGNRLLPLVLRLDAITSGACGVVSLVALPFMDDLLGTPTAFVIPVGVFLVLFASALWVSAGREGALRTAARWAVAVNVLWVADSVLVATAGWFDLTALGVGFLLFQAAAVALFAGMQMVGLRRLALT